MSNTEQTLAPRKPLLSAQLILQWKTDTQAFRGFNQKIFAGINQFFAIFIKAVDITKSLYFSICLEAGKTSFAINNVFCNQ